MLVYSHTTIGSCVTVKHGVIPALLNASIHAHATSGRVYISACTLLVLLLHSSQHSSSIVSYVITISIDINNPSSTHNLFLPSHQKLFSDEAIPSFCFPSFRFQRNLFGFRFSFLREPCGARVGWLGWSLTYCSPLVRLKPVVLWIAHSLTK